MEKAIGARRRKPVKISMVVCGEDLDGDHDLEGLDPEANLEMILSEAKMRQMFNQVQTMSPAFYQQMARELHHEREQQSPLPLLNKIIPLATHSPQIIPYNLSKPSTHAIPTATTTMMSPMDTSENFQIQTEPWDLSVKSKISSGSGSSCGGSPGNNEGRGGKKSYSEFYANALSLFESPPKKGRGEDIIIPTPHILSFRNQSHQQQPPFQLPLKRELIEQFRQQFQSRIQLPHSSPQQMFLQEQRKMNNINNNTVPAPRVTSSSSGSGGNSPSIIVPGLRTKGMSSKKEEIPNKPKQQRYRTERPFGWALQPVVFILVQ